MPIIVTNTMNIIGELQDSEKFIPSTIKKVLAGETVSVHSNADWSEIGSRFYLHARNQADALMFLLKNIDPEPFDSETEGQDMSRYNIVGEKELDNLKMAILIARYAGKELKYDLVDFHSSRPGHDLRYALDGSKLKAEGWEPPVSLEESLRRTVEWTIKNPEWLL